MKNVLGIMTLLALSVWARISVDFDTDRIEAGKPFQLILSVPLPELPSSHGIPQIEKLKGFKLSQVDSVDEQLNDFFRGRMKVRKFRFHLVAPSQSGTYQLPISWELQGQVRDIGEVKVEVQRPLDASALTVALTPSRKTIYEGEQISLKMTLLAYPNYLGGLNLSGVDLGTDFVAHRNDLEVKFNRSQKPGLMGEAHATLAWMVPIRSGALTIPALQFEYQKQGAPKVVKKQMGNMSFQSFSQAPEEAVARSREVVITAKPLPTQNRPAHFSGLVGQYSFEASIDKTSLQVGEALTLTVNIRGNGKPGSISDPEFPDFSQFRSVPPETKVSKKEKGDQIWTSKQWKVFLYPKKKGSFVIDPVRFSWFDPRQEKYQSIQSESWTIDVSKGEITEMAASGGTMAPAAPMSVEKQDIEELGQDIRFIVEPRQWEVARQPLLKSYGFWALFVIPWFLLLGLRVWLVRRRQLLSDPAFVRRSRANQHFRIVMQKAQESAQKGDVAQTYALVERGILEYWGDFTNCEFVGLTRLNLQKSMAEQGVPASVIQGIVSLLNQGDSARFAPQTSLQHDDLLKVVEQAKILCQGETAV